MVFYDSRKVVLPRNFISRLRSCLLRQRHSWDELQALLAHRSTCCEALLPSVPSMWVISETLLQFLALSSTAYLILIPITEIMEKVVCVFSSFGTPYCIFLKHLEVKQIARNSGGKARQCCSCSDPQRASALPPAAGCSRRRQGCSFHMIQNSDKLRHYIHHIIFF